MEFVSFAQVLKEVGHPDTVFIQACYLQGLSQTQRLTRPLQTKSEFDGESTWVIITIVTCLSSEVTVLMNTNRL